MGPHWMIVAKYIVVKVCLLSTCWDWDTLLWERINSCIKCW